VSPKERRKISRGTGRRYESTKPRPAAEPVRRARAPEPSRNEKSLRQRILDFAYQKSGRFKGDMQTALELYFEQKPGPTTPLLFDENEIPGFQEWYFFDFVTHTGQHIIDLFAEEIGPELNSEQRAMLADWLVWNRARLLEFQEVNPGIGVVVQDLLSEEVFEVNDISASYTATRWAFGLFRPILTDGRVSFTGSALLLPPTEKPEVLEIAQTLWAKYREARPQATLSDFYRDHSLDLHLALKRAQEEASKPPIFLTAEGHPMVVSRARYVVRGDPKEVEALLDAAEEFVYVGESEKHRGALHYDWLLCGRTHIPEATELPKRALQLTTEFVPGSGEARHRSVGDLNLGSKLMELECMSKERLAAGKALLAQILGNRVQHTGDQFQNMEKLLKRDESRPTSHARPTSPLRDAHSRAILQETAEQHTAAWLDEAIPALDGLTPRQAVQTPEGRKKVLDLIKVLEYHNDRREASAPPTMNIPRIRKELGL
jgi:hypothetical protein